MSEADIKCGHEFLCTNTIQRPPPEMIGLCEACVGPIWYDPGVIDGDSSPVTISGVTEGKETKFMLHFACWRDGQLWAAKQAAKEKREPSS